MYAEGCPQLSIVAGQAKRFSTRDHRRTEVTFNWPRLTLAGLAQRVFATSSVGRGTRAAKSRQLKPTTPLWNSLN